MVTLQLDPLIQLDATGPPSAVRLFPFGEVRTTKGVFRFTARSAELVTKQWAQLGRQFGFDYEHGLFDAAIPPHERRAAGWGDLELRQDGLWVVRITWTPAAAQKIADKEFRYLSPALQADKDREITGVQNCALTNLPATHHPQPLVLSARPRPSTAMMHAKQMMRALGALLAAAQAGAESEDATLKEVALKLAGDLPACAARLKEAFPDLGEGEGDEEAQQRQLGELLTTCEQITGVQGLPGQRGALLALQAQAKQKIQAGAAQEQAVRVALVDRLIRETRQVHPQDRAVFEALSLQDLHAYQKSAPRIGPPAASEVEGVQLTGQPPPAAQQQAEQAAEREALTLLNIDPKSAWFQPGQGLGVARARS